MSTQKAYQIDKCIVGRELPNPRCVGALVVSLRQYHMSRERFHEEEILTRDKLESSRPDGMIVAGAVSMACRVLRAQR